MRGAIAAQQRALLTARAVEDVEGIALHLLDLAALRRVAGEPESALATLAELLVEPPALPYPTHWRAEAARRAGLLSLDAGDAAGGARWAGRALELCRESRCSDEGAIVNLQARAALLGGDAAGAVNLAGKALALNRRAKNDVERANSSRIVADAQLAVGRHAEAAEAYAAALVIDKRLGLESKILLDLLGLGRVAGREGRRSEALGYLERARDVARAAGSGDGVAEAESLIEALRPVVPGGASRP